MAVRNFTISILQQNVNPHHNLRLLKQGILYSNNSHNESKLPSQTNSLYIERQAQLISCHLHQMLKEHLKRERTNQPILYSNKSYGKVNYLY